MLIANGNFTPDQIAEMTPRQQLVALKAYTPNSEDGGRTQTFATIDEYMKWKQANALR